MLDGTAPRRRVRREFYETLLVGGRQDRSTPGIEETLTDYRRAPGRFRAVTLA